MIGTIDISVQAYNPSMPLQPIFAFKDSPSSIRLRNVPKAIGTWKINQVFLEITYPDNSIKTVETKLVGGVWIGTVDGSAVSGRVENGYTVIANGIDENGCERNGYKLGCGQINILENDSVAELPIQKYQVKFYQSVPDNPNIGDLAIVDGIWQLFDGEHWIKEEVDISGINSRIDEVETKVNTIKVPTKTSQLTNDSNFITTNLANANYLYKATFDNFKAIAYTINSIKGNGLRVIDNSYIEISYYNTNMGHDDKIKFYPSTNMNSLYLKLQAMMQPVDGVTPSQVIDISDFKECKKIELDYIDYDSYSGVKKPVSRIEIGHFNYYEEVYLTLKIVELNTSNTLIDAYVWQQTFSIRIVQVPYLLGVKIKNEVDPFDMVNSLKIDKDGYLNVNLGFINNAIYYATNENLSNLDSRITELENRINALQGN